MLLSVDTFAGLAIASDADESLLPSGKPSALVVYLAVESTRVNRQVLAKLLWSELEETKARNSLRVALSQIRKALGEALVTQDEDVWLDPAKLGRVDTAEFTHAIETGNWQSAIEIYRGPFLDGIAIDGVIEFEEWVSRMRERFHRSAVVALECLADERLEIGDTHIASDVLTRLVAVEPWNEKARRSLMTLLAEAGNPDAAIEEYRRLSASLADDLGTVPQRDTVMLAESIAMNSSPSRVGVLSRIPAPATSIIGRDREMETIIHALHSGDHRLVTLTGPGGVGKTRLAHEAILELGRTEPIATAFVDLSGLVSASGIPGAVSRALGMSLVGIRDPIDELCGILQDFSALLLLDNLEQLMPDAADLVHILLQRCPNVSVIGTCRFQLGVAGEFVVRVRPLSVPSPLNAEMAGNPSVELFLARARATGASVSDMDTSEIAELCRQLEGLPLAIELAAFHTRFLTPQELAASLWGTVGVMGDSAVDRPARHQTLSRSIEWSYRLLDEPARQLLRSLGIFRGGVPLDLLNVGFAPEVATLASIGSLMDAGLVDRIDVAGMGRLTLMESTRAFAAAELDACGEEAAVGERHFVAVLDLVQRADQGLRSSDQLSWVARLEAEHDNIAVALRYASGKDPGSFLKLVNALAWFWHNRGYLHEGRRWLMDAIDSGEGVAGLERNMAYALLNNSLISMRIGETLGETAVDVGIDYMIDRAGSLLSGCGASELDLLEVSLIRALRMTFSVNVDAASIENVLPVLRNGIAVLTASNEMWRVARFTLCEAKALRHLPDLDGALATARRSRRIFEEIGDRRGMAVAMTLEGGVAGLMGDYEGCRTTLTDALKELLPTGDIVQIVFALHALGANLMTKVRGRIDGARLLGAGAKLCDNSGMRLPASSQSTIDYFVTEARKSINDEEWNRSWDEGWNLGIGVHLPE